MTQAIPASTRLITNTRDGDLHIQIPMIVPDTYATVGRISWDKEELELIVSVAGNPKRFDTMGAVNAALEWLESQGCDIDDESRSLLMGFWFASNALS